MITCVQTAIHSHSIENAPFREIGRSVFTFKRESLIGKEKRCNLGCIFSMWIPEAGLEPARLAASHFECDVSAIPPLGHNNNLLTAYMKVGGGNRNRTGGKGVADPCLTAWLCRRKKVGAEDGIRTRDPDLGKVVFYH